MDWEETFEKYEGSKSPFEATNEELARSRFDEGIDFKSDEELAFWLKMTYEEQIDEEYRLKIGREKFGY